MPRIKSLEDLQRVREEALQKRQQKTGTGNVQVIVGMGTPGIAAGARDTMKAILEFIEKNNLSHIHVHQTGNVGFDSFEPIVQIVRGEDQKISYGRVTPAIARRIMDEHVLAGTIVSEHQIETQ